MQPGRSSTSGDRVRSEEWDVWVTTRDGIPTLVINRQLKSGNIDYVPLTRRESIKLASDLLLAELRTDPEIH